MTARIEPSEFSVASRAELGKRQHVPFRVVDNCPMCGAEYVVDLANGHEHLNYAKQGVATTVHFHCADFMCNDHEWEVAVVARVTLELFDPATITSQLGLRAEGTE